MDLQTISEVTPSYIIKAGYHFKILHIQLKILQEKVVKLYELTISDDNLSVEMKILFNDTQTIFYCLFNRETYQVIAEKGQILIRMPDATSEDRRKTSLLNLE